MSSARISFTKTELIRLRDFYGMAWGRDTKGAKKLERALQQIEAKEAQK